MTIAIPIAAPSALCGTRTIVEDHSVLCLRDAVAAIILASDGRYLLQQRDDLPGIWYPDHWGCFGGGVDPGETADMAMRRELREELQWESEFLAEFTQLDFDLTGMGLRRYFRKYFVAAIDDDQVPGLKLGEGRALKACALAQILCELRLTPYDAFALYLHFRAPRLADGV